MKEIARYSPTINDKPYKPYAYCEARLDGAFVSFADHAAIVAGKDAHIAALQEQVRALAAESARCKFEISRCHQTVDEMFKNPEKWIDKEWLSSIWSTSKRLMDETPATNAALREIRAQAVESYANYSDECYGTHDNSGEDARIYAARIRSGEQS